jgi:hypothetical protein
VLGGGHVFVLGGGHVFVLEVSILPLSEIFLLYFRTVQTVWHCFVCSLYYLHNLH